MPFFIVCLVGLLVSVYATLASPPMVAGHVRLPDGSPVEGAQVVLFDVADLRRGPVGQATTDETGQFALPLAAGGAFVLPQEVGLGSNYPNPFNPSTIIPYQLSAPSSVRLEVFNILGQRMTTLVDGPQGAGAYRARWDGTDAAGRAAASGVYFYRLTVAGAHWTGKMVLLDGQAGVPLGGASVAAVSRVEGSFSTYGLVVSGDGLVTYVDSDFGVAAGQGPVELVVSAEPNVRGKVVPTLEGLLGDVDNNGHVDLDDGVLVAMLSVNPVLSLPNHGVMTLGDVNCDGRVELADAALLATYVANPSDSEVSSLRMGQPGGYSLDPVTEVVWGSILCNEQQDATVARLLDEVPVLISGVLPVEGEDRLYLGIDRAYWDEHGGKPLYEALKQRFPATPIHVEPSIGVVRNAGKGTTRPTTALRNVAPVTLLGPPLSFAESPHTALQGTANQQHVVGRITVPDDVRVGTVSVSVDITHPFKSDLKIDLVAPSGVVTTLYDGVGDGINPEANLVGAWPVTTALQGQRAQGIWQLRVGDYERGDTGTLNSWSLAITPAQDGGDAEEPVNLFLETFQEGLGAWQTTKWEAASLQESAVPGEGPGNIVAKATGCGICFLNLTSPIDLSDHESVTLSFYRWLDPGMGDNEFLGVDIGNNGRYRRLENWNKNDADGQWRLETFTLSSDDISDTFSLRFFSISTNTFTTVAIDNIMIAATPGSVIVEPVQDAPDLGIESFRLTPATAEPGERLSIRVTISNVDAGGMIALEFYRHAQPTETTKQATARVLTSGGELYTNEIMRLDLHTDAPEQAGTYYYYVCIRELPDEADTTNNCASTTVTVQSGETESPAPDLTAEFAFTPRATAKAGASVTFFARIRNIGDAPVSESTFRLYRHTTRTATPQLGGTLAATTTAPGPAAGKTIFRTLRSRVLNAGTYHFYLCADRAENETNTGNNCTTTPATITVQAEETPETEPEPETPAVAAFSVTDTNATPQSVQSTYTLTITATVTNTGSEADSATITVYRHSDLTTTPRTGGIREPNTTTTGSLSPNGSVMITSTHEAPTVSRVTKYYYYVCADTFCSEIPATAVVRVKPEDTAQPPYESCWSVPERNLPMGGDVMFTQPLIRASKSCGTLTLGGVETEDGTRGFIVSGHVTAISVEVEDGVWRQDYSLTDNLIGHNRDSWGNVQHLLGKVHTMPSFFQEGDKRILSADAAFVAYPRPTTPGCSLTWSGNHEEFCLDSNDSEQIERLAPLQVRGEGDTVHTVIGSRAVTEGLPIRISGTVTGEPISSIASGNKLLLYDFHQLYHHYSYYSHGGESLGGDSGAPVYTAPDADSNVSMVGIFTGFLPGGGERAFNSWKQVEDAFNLKPLGAPASDGPAEEAEEELADFFSAFD